VVKRVIWHLGVPRRNASVVASTDTGLESVLREEHAHIVPVQEEMTEDETTVQEIEDRIEEIVLAHGEIARIQGTRIGGIVLGETTKVGIDLEVGRETREAVEEIREIEVEDTRGHRLTESIDDQPVQNRRRKITEGGET
jgi:hypothetical protein